MKTKLLIFLPVLVLLGVPASLFGLWWAAGGTETNPGVTEMYAFASQKWSEFFKSDKSESDKDEEDEHEGAAAPMVDVNGMAYDDARTALMAKGWKPNKNSPAYGESDAVKKGNGPLFWNRGYQELRACAGVGTMECVFELFDGEGGLLVVTTEGVEDPGGGTRAKVVRTAMIVEPTQDED